MRIVVLLGVIVGGGIAVVVVGGRGGLGSGLVLLLLPPPATALALPRLPGGVGARLRVGAVARSDAVWLREHLGRHGWEQREASALSEWGRTAIGVGVRERERLFSVDLRKWFIYF